MPTKIGSELINAPLPINIVDNGGFNVWQRGTTITNPANGDFFADRWRLYIAGATGVTSTITKETTDTDGEQASMKIVISSMGTGTEYMMYQKPEHYTTGWAGKTISVSVRVKTTIANKVCLRVLDSANHYSAFHTGSGNWETLTVTGVTLSGNFNNIAIGQFSAIVTASTGTIYIGKVMAVFGDRPVDYIPEPPAIEIERCQRHYEKGRISYGAIGGDDGSNYSMELHVPLKTAKVSTPTSTFSGWIIKEVGSATNVEGSYTKGSSITVTDVGLFCYKAKAESAPDYARADWEAEVT